MLDVIKNKINGRDTLEVKKDLIIHSFAEYYNISCEELERKFFKETLIVPLYRSEDVLKDIQYALFDKMDKMHTIMEQYDDERLKVPLFKWGQLKQFELNMERLTYVMLFLSITRSNVRYEEIRDKAVDIINTYMGYNLSAQEIEKAKDNNEFDYIIEPAKALRSSYDEYLELIKLTTPYKTEEEINISACEEIEFKKLKQLYEPIKDRIPKEEQEIFEACETLEDVLENACNLKTIKFYCGLSFVNRDYTPVFLKFMGPNQNRIKQNKLAKEYGKTVEQLQEEVQDDFFKRQNKIYEIILKSFKEEYIKVDKEINRVRNYFEGYNFMIMDKDRYANIVANRTNLGGNVIFDFEVSRNVMIPILMVDLSPERIVDSSLIHELNHRLEMNITNTTPDQIDFMCGWQKGVAKNNCSISGDRCRAINEAINHKITEDIIAIMRGKGRYIFDNPEPILDQGKRYHSAYETQFPVINEFFETYKEVIKESRLKNDLNIIYDAVGKENFEALNSLVDEYEKYFKQHSFYKLKAAIKKKKDIPECQQYEEYMKRKNEILQNMYEFENSRKQTQKY